MAKKFTNAQLVARVAELEAELSRFANSATAVTTSDTDVGLTRYNISGIKKDAMSHTPNAVDAIRSYTWPLFIKGVERKIIVASLVSQGFNKATVHARVKRIFDGTEESCYSEAIRARLGLDELESEAEAEHEEDELEEDGEE
jgi:hypothetical protein